MVVKCDRCHLIQVSHSGLVCSACRIFENTRDEFLSQIQRFVDENKVDSVDDNNNNNNNNNDSEIVLIELKGNTAVDVRKKGIRIVKNAEIVSVVFNVSQVDVLVKIEKHVHSVSPTTSPVREFTVTEMDDTFYVWCRFGNRDNHGFFYNNIDGDREDEHNNNATTTTTTSNSVVDPYMEYFKTGGINPMILPVITFATSDAKYLNVKMKGFEYREGYSVETLHKTVIEHFCKCRAVVWVAYNKKYNMTGVRFKKPSKQPSKAHATFDTRYNGGVYEGLRVISTSPMSQLRTYTNAEGTVITKPMVVCNYLFPEGCVFYNCLNVPFLNVPFSK